MTAGGLGLGGRGLRLTGARPRPLIRRLTLGRPSMDAGNLLAKSGIDEPMATQRVEALEAGRDDEGRKGLATAVYGEGGQRRSPVSGRGLASGRQMHAPDMSVTSTWTASRRSRRASRRRASVTGAAMLCRDEAEAQSNRGLGPRREDGDDGSRVRIFRAAASIVAERRPRFGSRSSRRRAAFWMPAPRLCSYPAAIAYRRSPAPATATVRCSTVQHCPAAAAAKTHDDDTLATPFRDPGHDDDDSNR